MTEQLLVLLPPSETKTDGGNSPFPNSDRWPEYRWPELNPVRETCIHDLVELSTGPAEDAAKALKISTRQAELELTRNRALLTAPLKPAVERYTGVLFDALDAPTLTADARQWLDSHVAIHSALYGLVAADDPIAAYRLSYNSRLPGQNLKLRWRDSIRNALTQHRGPVLDLRSKGYVGLGPLPSVDGAEHAWGNVAQRQPDGSLKSLNHFNKHGKGRLVRLLAERLAGRDEPVTLLDIAGLVEDEFEVSEAQYGVVDIVAR